MKVLSLYKFSHGLLLNNLIQNKRKSTYYLLSGEIDILLTMLTSCMLVLKEIQLGILHFIVLLMMEQGLMKILKYSRFSKVGRNGGVKFHYLILKLKAKNFILIWI